MNECSECGSIHTEYHHIVYRSQGGLTFPINEKRLCPEHHKGISGPHRSKKKDLQYKREMQAQLQNKLCKDYYTPEELINILDIQKSQVQRVVKTLPLHKEGYDKTDIIRRLMGGRLYD